MTPEEKANELIRQNQPSAAEQLGFHAPPDPALQGQFPGDNQVRDFAESARLVREARQAAVTDAGNIPQDVTVQIPPDSSAQRVGGNSGLEPRFGGNGLLDGFRAFGVNARPVVSDGGEQPK